MALEGESQRQRHKRTWIALACVALLVLAAFGTSRVYTWIVDSQPVAMEPLAKWQTYHDPMGLFTMRVPSNWTQQVVMGKPAMEIITFNTPSQREKSAQISVTVSSLTPQAACPSIDPTTIRHFVPITVNSLKPGALTIFQTENASFQIDVTINSVLAPSNFGPVTPTPTPAPATWVNADETEINEMLASFHPTDAKPLKC